MLRLSTQIGSAAHTKMNPLFRICDQLQELDIKVTHPHDGLIFTSGPWDQYEYELSFYDALASSSFHITWNEDSQITQELALQIAYAMLKQKAIVLLEKPLFTPEVNPFIRDLITAHLKEVHIVHLQGMEPAELNYELKNLPQSVDYHLSMVENILIKSHVKANFRTLLNNAKAESRIGHSIPA